MAVLFLLPTETQPRLQVELAVDRPPPGAYGVVSAAALAKPLAVQLEGPRKVVRLLCEEAASLVTCRADAAWFEGAAAYGLVVVSDDVPSEGRWSYKLDLPASTETIAFRGRVSLRYGKAGLAAESVHVSASASSDVRLSSSWLARQPAHERSRKDFVPFELTNGSTETIFVEGAGSHPYGRLYRAAGDAWERVRHGRDLCGDLWATIEVALKPQETIPISEPMNDLHLEPGRYRFEVLYSHTPAGSTSTREPLIVFRISYDFDIG
jgi:hypothetical protein